MAGPSYGGVKYMEEEEICIVRKETVFAPDE